MIHFDLLRYFATHHHALRSLEAGEDFRPMHPCRSKCSQIFIPDVTSDFFPQVGCMPHPPSPASRASRHGPASRAPPPHFSRASRSSATLAPSSATYASRQVQARLKTFSSRRLTHWQLRLPPRLHLRRASRPFSSRGGHSIRSSGAPRVSGALPGNLLWAWRYCRLSSALAL